MSFSKQRRADTGEIYYNDSSTPLTCDSCMLLFWSTNSDVYYTCSEQCDYDVCQRCAQCNKGHSLTRKQTATVGACKKCGIVKETRYECLGATCHDYAVCADCLKLPMN